jgi:hypothetical protein
MIERCFKIKDSLPLEVDVNLKSSHKGPLLRQNLYLFTTVILYSMHYEQTSQYITVCYPNFLFNLHTLRYAEK